MKSLIVTEIYKIQKLHYDEWKVSWIIYLFQSWIRDYFLSPSQFSLFEISFFSFFFANFPYQLIKDCSNFFPE